jgi:GTP cyclohydrolase II
MELLTRFRCTPDNARTVNNGEPPNAGVASVMLPTRFGSLAFRAYEGADGTEPVAIAAGEVRDRDDLPVRVHSACFTAENVGSLRCDCREQLDYSMEYIARWGGVVIYLHQEGRGIGLTRKIEAYALQEQGHDTVDANSLLGLPEDARTYGDAAAILRDLGVRSIRLMTNNPRKIEALVALGVNVTGRIPVLVPPNHHSAAYLRTKATRMGHLVHD